VPPRGGELLEPSQRNNPPPPPPQAAVGRTACRSRLTVHSVAGRTEFSGSTIATSRFRRADLPYASSDAPMAACRRCCHAPGSGRPSQISLEPTSGGRQLCSERGRSAAHQRAHGVGCLAVIEARGGHRANGRSRGLSRRPAIGAAMPVSKHTRTAGSGLRDLTQSTRCCLSEPRIRRRKAVLHRTRRWVAQSRSIQQAVRYEVSSSQRASSE